MSRKVLCYGLFLSLLSIYINNNFISNFYSNFYLRLLSRVISSQDCSMIFFYSFKTIYHFFMRNINNTRLDKGS